MFFKFSYSSYEVESLLLASLAFLVLSKRPFTASLQPEPVVEEPEPPVPQEEEVAPIPPPQEESQPIVEEVVSKIDISMRRLVQEESTFMHRVLSFLKNIGSTLCTLVSLRKLFWCM